MRSKRAFNIMISSLFFGILLYGLTGKVKETLLTTFFYLMFGLILKFIILD